MIAAAVFGLAVTGADAVDTVPRPAWTLSTTSAAVDDTISAWLAIPVALKQRVTTELQSTPAVTTWFADSTCGSSPATSKRVDSVSAVVHVCAAPRAPGSIRLVALVTRAADKQKSTIEAVGSDIIGIKPPWSVDLPAWSIALLTSITGFIAGLTLQYAQQRRQRKDKIDDEAREAVKAKEDHRRETEQVLTKALAPETAVNVQRLRDVVAGRIPQILNADASALFTEKQRSLFAYLGDDGSKALDDLAQLYTAINAYNRIRTKLTEERTAGGILPAREQQLIDGMRRQAPLLLAMFENLHQNARTQCDAIKAIASQTI